MLAAQPCGRPRAPPRAPPVRAVLYDTQEEGSPSLYPLEALSEDGETLSILEADYKYVWNARGDHALHDLSGDPGERVNLIDRERDRAVAMETRLTDYLRSLPRPPDAGEPQLLDEETRKALENLGYLE